jgi:hypothetical protein
VTHPGSFGSIVPIRDLDDAIVRPMRDLTRRVQQLESNSLGRNGITVNNADGSSVARLGSQSNGGNGIRFFYPDGSTAFQAGRLPDGRAEVTAYRDDGSTAMRVGGNAGQPQFFGVYDRQSALNGGGPVFSDDTLSGFGIGTPWIPWPTFVNTDPSGSGWPHTANSAWTTVARCAYRAQHPKLYWTGSLYAPTGVTAEARMVFAGTQVGLVTTATSNTTVSFNGTNVAIPPGTLRDALVFLEIEARITAGAGDCKVNVYGGYGRQS